LYIHYIETLKNLFCFIKLINYFYFCVLKECHKRIYFASLNSSTIKETYPKTQLLC